MEVLGLIFICLSIFAVDGTVNENRKIGMCVNHDDSIKGMIWKKVQGEVFDNRFEDDADCELGDPEAGTERFCKGDNVIDSEENDDLEQGFAAGNEGRRRFFRRRYDRVCARGKAVHMARSPAGCCIKRINGKLMGVYGESTLPCFEKRNIPGKPHDEMEWADRIHCICSLINGTMTIPECSVDSHCPENHICRWARTGNACTMSCV